MEREILVMELMDALSKLEPTDTLFPNLVGNLTIVRGTEMIGVIHLRPNMPSRDRVEMFGDEEYQVVYEPVSVRGHYKLHDSR